MNAERLAAFYAEKGFRVQIEAGTVGLVVYASSRRDAERVAADLAGSARARDPRARAILPALRDESGDEPEETAWWTAVEFDWRRF